MKKELIDVIFASEKRKDTLLILQAGPRDMETILCILKTNRHSLLPQIKILKEGHLVKHHKDTYELTTIGKLIVDEMRTLVDTISVLDTDIDYWGNRKLNFLPPYLLKRIRYLEKCKVINPSIQNIYALPEQIYGAFTSFQETSSCSNSFTAVTSFFYPNYYDIFKEMLQKDVKIDLIITQSLHNKRKASEHDHITDLLKNELFDLYIYPEDIDFVSFAYDDHHLLLRLLNKNGEYDYKYMICNDQKALQWGKDLYEYYSKDSIPISEV